MRKKWFNKRTQMYGYWRQTKNKCKCFRNNIGCSASCECLGCANVYGANKNVSVRKRKQTSTSSCKSYKKLRTTKFLKSIGSQQNLGTWTLDESVALFTCMEILSEAQIDTCPENVHTAYMFLFDHVNRNMGSNTFRLRIKSLNQINHKLRYESEMK